MSKVAKRTEAGLGRGSFDDCQWTPSRQSIMSLGSEGSYPSSVGVDVGSEKRDALLKERIGIPASFLHFRTYRAAIVDLDLTPEYRATCRSHAHCQKRSMRRATKRHHSTR